MTVDPTLATWVAEQTHLGLDANSMRIASSDAGFRQYWRVEDAQHRSWIVMDASRETPEHFEAFVRITALMHEAGVHAPTIYAQESQQRFLVLDDLGSQTFLHVLNESNARTLMDAAIEALVAWQKISRPGVLPAYDREVLARELDLFPEWYVKVHKQVTWTEEQWKWWSMSKEALLEAIVSQANVFVHRDFMPRNLMVSTPNPGVLDYQDALYGPVSYDIASLMRDAFISWSDSFVLDMTIRYWDKARQAGIPVPEDFATFYQDVDMMSAQRHLKVLGIFARLNYRDHKPKYLEDAPRFVDYLLKTARRYRALSPLARLIQELENQTPSVGYTF